MMDFCLRNHDLEVSNGDFALCPTEVDSIAQAMTIRIKTLAGEWFLDTSIGVPYLTEILGQKRNERFIRQMLLPEIQAVHGVQHIKDFEAKEEPHRKLSISFAAVLTDGSQFQIEESIGV